MDCKSSKFFVEALLPFQSGPRQLSFKVGDDDSPSQIRQYFADNPAVGAFHAFPEDDFGTDSPGHTIYLNPTLCDAQEPFGNIADNTVKIQVLSALYHEALHANLYAQLDEAGWTPNGNVTLESFFNLTCNTGSGLNTQHMVIIRDYIDRLVRLVWEMNDKKGSRDAYYISILGALDYYDSSTGMYAPCFKNEFYSTVAERNLFINAHNYSLANNTTTVQLPSSCN